MGKGVLNALEYCLCAYGQHELMAKIEQVADRGSSRIDYVLEVDGEDVALLEVTSPQVMNSLNVGELLPPNGIELTWACRQPLASKLLTKVSTLFSSPTTLALKKYM